MQNNYFKALKNTLLNSKLVVNVKIHKLPILI